jgi:hypothetical protein
MRLGAWSSTAFLTYLRETTQLFEKARAALAGTQAMDFNDVLRLDGAGESGKK